MRLPLAMTILTLVLSACSNGGSQLPVQPVTPQSTPPVPTVGTVSEFTYEYKFNGCTTGKHSFSAKKDYCNALLDDALNANCARELRLENYNRQCTGGQAVNPGMLPASSTARCVVNGMDLKDRTFLDNINPFKPQRSQNFRDIFWSTKRSQSYDILFSGTSLYGRTIFSMTPATQTQAARGEILLQQRKGVDTFSVSSGLGSQLNLTVTNYRLEKEVEAACVSHPSFKRPKADLSRVRCSYSSGGMQERPLLKEEVFAWDLRNTVQKEIYRGRHNESLIVRLKPAVGGQDERIEIEAVDLDLDKTLKASSSLNEGLKVRYLGRQTGNELILDCAVASK